MNLNEQTYRIKQMMGLLSENPLIKRTDLKVSADFKQKQEILNSVDSKLRAIYFKMANAVGVDLPLKYGKRTQQQNANAGGANNSAHLRGLALDFYFKTPQKDLIKKLIKVASDNGVLGVGAYRDGQDLHIDIDNSSGKGRRAWGSDYTYNTVPDWAKQEIDYHMSKNKTNQNINNKGGFSAVLVGGLEHRNGDINLDGQIGLLSKGLGIDKTKIKGFHHNDSPADIVKFIQSNPGIKVFLFSWGCQKADTISRIQNIKKEKVYIIEPYAPSGKNDSVSTAINNGVPKTNVFYGEDRYGNLPKGSFGKGLGGTPSGAATHFDSLTTVGQKVPK